MGGIFISTVDALARALERLRHNAAGSEEEKMGSGILYGNVRQLTNDGPEPGPKPRVRHDLLAEYRLETLEMAKARIKELEAELVDARETASKWATERIESLKENEKLLRDALTKALEAMDMQEKRESGEFHILQPSAKVIWDAAKGLARIALDKTAK